MNNILLLSDGSPSATVIDPNEILLRFFFKHFDRKKVFRFMIMRKVGKDLPKDWMGFDSEVYNNIYEISVKKFGKYINWFLKYLINIYIVTFRIPFLYNKLLKIYKENSFDKICMVATSPQLILIGYKLVKETKLPLHLIIWDTPEQYTLNLKMPEIFRNRVLKRYYYLIRNSKKIGVGSQALGEYFNEKFNKETYLMQGDIIESHIITSKLQVSDKEIVIGFAGTMYTSGTWSAFLDALNKMNWEYESKKILLRIIGNSFSQELLNNSNIEFLGARKIEEAMSILSQCSINFVPYSFEHRSKIEAEFSFPSKINTYLRAGRPIYAIAPNYSSVFKFVTNEKIGICCTSVIPNQIVDSLKYLLGNTALILETTKNINKIYTDKFSTEKLLERFNKFIDAS